MRRSLTSRAAQTLRVCVGIIAMLAVSVSAQRAPATGVRTLASVLQLHELLISPASDAVFNASTDPPADDKG